MRNIANQLIEKNLLRRNAQNGMGIIEFLVAVLVVALLSSVTIPMLHNKIPKKNNQSAVKTPNPDTQSWKLAYKDAYTDASQIWSQLYSEGALNSRGGWGSDQANYHNFTQFMNKFNILKQCSYPDNSECWGPNETSDVASGHPDSSGDRCFMDSSGRAWCDASMWGWFMVDTNGSNAPNSFGKDRFILYTIAGNDINASGIPDRIIYDSDYNSQDAARCPNPPCYYTSWITDN